MSHITPYILPSLLKTIFFTSDGITTAKRPDSRNAHLYQFYQRHTYPIRDGWTESIQVTSPSGLPTYQRMKPQT